MKTVIIKKKEQASALPILIFDGSAIALPPLKFLHKMAYSWGK
jgi:hypothetical protein